MPTGPTDLHAYWCRLDPRGAGDNAAISFLKRRGYKLTRRWSWIPPKPDHRPTFKESKAIRYLILEWDFDGLETVNA